MPDARMTQILENITTAGDGVDVYLQDQTTPPFHFYIMREDKIDIGLTAPVLKDDTVLNLTAGHGFTYPAIPLDYLVIWENGIYEQVKIINVTANQITIDVPSPVAFSINAVLIRGKIDLDLDGSGTPINAYFRFYGPDAEIPIDIIGVQVSMLHGSASDRSKYGNLAGLLDGKSTYFRHINGVTVNLGSYQNNQDFEEFGWDVAFDDKAGGGNFATTCTMDIKQKYGVAKRINPRTNDSMCVTVRGDLRGLNRHRVCVYGQYTQGE